MKPLKEVPLHLVENVDDRSQFLDWALRAEPPFAVDVETTGLQPFGKHRDKLRLVQFGTADEGWALPFEGNWGAIKDIIKLWQQRGLISNHNSIFDEVFLNEAGIDTGPRWDCTFIGHHLTFPNDYHGLKPAAGQLYGREARGGEKWLKKVMKKNGWDWATVPIDHPAYWGYAAFDTVLAARLAGDVLPRAKEEFGPQYELERRVARISKQLSKRGMPIDLEYTAQLLEKWRAEEAELLTVLQGYAIQNPGSRKQLITALENEGWEPDQFTETGQPKTNRAVLEGLEMDIAKKVLRWRRLGKWCSSYLEPFLESGGRVHANINSLGARHGRMSVDTPPLQQVPRGPDVRRCFLAEEGEEFWKCDYNSQEARMTFVFSRDREYLDSVLAGDPHTKVASLAYGIPESEVPREKRSKAKNCFYAYGYGAQPKRLAETAGVSLAEGQRIFEALQDAFPGLARHMDKVIAKGEERLKADGMAWARTLGGRIVAAPKTKLFVLNNYLISGSSADMMKGALGRIDDAGHTPALNLVVHDEVLMSVPKGSKVPHEVADLMRCEAGGCLFEVGLTGPQASWAG